MHENGLSVYNDYYIFIFLKGAFVIEKGDWDVFFPDAISVAIDHFKKYSWYDGKWKQRGRFAYLVERNPIWSNSG